MEEWRPLREFVDYSVSNLGRVRNDRRDTFITPVPTHYKPYVGLMYNGVQVKRSLSKLVCDTFVPRPTNPLFTTPIHLDGESNNCAAANLVWRPRWFAIQHSRQFTEPVHEYDWGVRDIKTREEFQDCWAAVFNFGLLYIDVVMSVAVKTYVFPTMQIFERIL